MITIVLAALYAMAFIWGLFRMKLPDKSKEKAEEQSKKNNKKNNAMTREEAKEFYSILQAYAEGKVIECRTKPSAIEGTDVPNDWTEMKEIEFWRNIEYRIKP